MRALLSEFGKSVSEVLDQLGDLLAASFTPEDKFGPTGYDAPGTPGGSEVRYVPGGETLGYRVEFWNKEDAPVPTQDAIIEDVLDPTVFDLSTFEFTRIGFLKWDVPLAGVPQAKLTTFVDTSGYVDRKIDAFHSHKTQGKDASRILSRDGYREFARRETYVLAKSRIASVSLPESDLFAGIPPEEPGER